MAEQQYADPDNAYESPHGEASTKKPKGCLFYGCLISFLLFLLVVVGGGIAGYFALKGQIEAYTDEQPAEIPVVEATEEEVAEIEGRIEQLTSALENGEPAQDLVLTADEINKMISQNDDFKGKVYVTIENGKVSGDISIPTDFLPMAKDRYFNASATLNVSYENGILIVTLADATVKGQPLPPEFIQGFQSQNLANELYKDPENAKFLRQFESIEVQDNQIILKLRDPEELAAEADADGNTGGNTVEDSAESQDAGELELEEATAE